MELNFTETTIGGKTARFLKYNTEGIPAHFYGANGFPLGAYQEFLKYLSPTYQLNCLSLRPCWPGIGSPQKQTNWEIYADDLIEFVEQQYDEPIVAIGHSQGATSSLIAASKRPDLFQSLILIEPASVSPWINFLLKTLPYAYKKTRAPINVASTKQSIWPSREAFLESYRSNRAYRRISDKVLADFADYGLTQQNDGAFKLVFSPQWEASNYARAPYLGKYLKKVNIPMKVIGGKPSLFFSQSIRDNWGKMTDDATLLVDLNFGHLFPLEGPEKCADLVLSTVP